LLQVRRLEQRLRETGSVTPRAHVHAGRPRTVRTSVSEDPIITAVEREPWRNSRDIARESGLPEPRGLEVLRGDQLHPHHYSRSASLFPDDRPLWIQFCEGYDISTHNILWTDEACFTREGVFNVHSTHLWTMDNLQIISEREYGFHFSVSVWAVIDGDIVVVT
jgi:hypothetical protein